MPNHVEKRGRAWVVVDDATGKVKSHHTSRRDAAISGSIRERAAMGKAMTETILEGRISKAVRITKEDGERQNLVFGWANVPEPVKKNGAPEGSLEEEIEDLRAAYQEQYPQRLRSDGALDPHFYTWIVASFPDYVIAQRTEDGECRYFRHSYVRSTEDDEDTIVFAEGIEVELAYVEKMMKGLPDYLEEKAKGLAGKVRRGIKRVTEPRRKLLDALKSAPKVDLQGDIVPMEELEAAAYNFVLHSRTGDVDHSEVQHAVLVESFLATDEKLALMGLDEDMRARVNKGWWLGYLVDDETMDAVERGDLEMFSIGGRSIRDTV